MVDRDPAWKTLAPRPAKSENARRSAAVVFMTCALLLGNPGCTRGQVREPILAGSWYPKDAGELRRTVQACLGAAAVAEPVPVALIVPHAGYQFSGATAGLSRKGAVVS